MSTVENDTQSAPKEDHVHDVPNLDYRTRVPMSLEDNVLEVRYLYNYVKTQTFDRYLLQLSDECLIDSRSRKAKNDQDF